MNPKLVWRKLFGFVVGDKVRVINPKLPSYRSIGRVTQIVRAVNETLYEVEVELLSEEKTSHLSWALCRKEDLELITDEE